MHVNGTSCAAPRAGWKALFADVNLLTLVSFAATHILIWDLVLFGVGTSGARGLLVLIV